MLVDDDDDWLYLIYIVVKMRNTFNGISFLLLFIIVFVHIIFVGLSIANFGASFTKEVRLV